MSDIIARAKDDAKLPGTAKCPYPNNSPACELWHVQYQLAKLEVVS